MLDTLTLAMMRAAKNAPPPDQSKVPAQEAMTQPAGGVNVLDLIGLHSMEFPETGPININDDRKINPASGLPFKKMGGKSVQADPELVKKIVAHAKAQGVDPNTALAIGLQETGLGYDEQEGNVGHILGKYWDAVPKNKMSEDDENAYAMVNALKDKMNYAKKLGYDKKGEAYTLQAYNGYGKIDPDTEEIGARSFYGIPVSKGNPLYMAKNPAYGKTVISLRDELIKKNPAIQQLIRDTPPFQMPASAPADDHIQTPKGNVLMLSPISAHLKTVQSKKP